MFVAATLVCGANQNASAQANPGLVSKFLTAAKSAKDGQLGSIASELTGKVQELQVMGRGPARRLQIVLSKSEMQSGAHDSSIITVKAVDQWNNPALDGQVELESTLGQIIRANETRQSLQVTTTQANQPPAKLALQFENGEAKAVLLGSAAPGEAHLRAQTGDLQAESSVRITPESRPTILIGMAATNYSIGFGIALLGISYFVCALVPGLFIRERMFDPQAVESTPQRASLARTAGAGG